MEDIKCWKKVRRSTKVILVGRYSNLSRNNDGRFHSQNSIFSRYTLSVSSPSYYSRHQPHLNEPPGDGESAAPSNIDNLTTSQAPTTWEPERETLGERLLARVRAIRPVRFSESCDDFSISRFLRICYI